MKMHASILGLALLLGIAGSAQAAIMVQDNVPAATLLLPYFEVDTASAAGTRSVFTVGNSSPAEVLAHVTLWTDRGVPTHTFNIRLAGHDLAEVDLGELFLNGTTPTSTVGGFAASCGGQLPAPTLTAAQVTGLRNAHRGLASTLLGGSCGGAVHGDALARGYVTVDVVNSCTTLAPGDTGYFVTGGTGIASNANVLWGEQSTFNQTQGFAYGDALVHIEASATNPATDGNLDPGDAGAIPPRPPQTIPDYTFYGRRQTGSVADNREALTETYLARYSKRGVINSTKALIWRDPGDVDPFACNSAPVGLRSRENITFDDQEQLAFDRSALQAPYATQSISLGTSTQTNVPFNSGFIFYQLGFPTNTGTYRMRNQAHVSHVLGGSGGAAQTAGWPYLSINDNSFNLPVGFPECSDGFDNDGDGLTDFPADTSCLSATGESENPACGDGIDNDGDTLIDFPADPECSNIRDNTENSFEPQCRDGVDNDADGLIDFPTDPGCSNPNDNTEFRGQCDDGIDNDGDGLIDFPADNGCSSVTDSTETFAACGDGIDNDGDGLIDFPADRGCRNIDDNDEVNAVCADGIDNDGDSLIDFPADLGCVDQFDNAEENEQCSDGIDNDGDGLFDFPADPGCENAQSFTEAPQCNDGNDNDLDGAIDFPADIGCSTAWDTREFSVQCSDGVDNDSDGLIDFPEETSCLNPNDDFEGADCSDGLDNDLDGLIDFPADPGCSAATDNNELAGSSVRACSDGLDNDGDLLVDFPNDTGCTSVYDDIEFLPFEIQGVPPEPVLVPTMGQYGLMLTVVLMLLAGGIGLRHRQFAGA